MSISEDGVSVLTCLANAISAFHESETIIERIKVKLAEDVAPHLLRLLEESMYQAPEAIEKERQRGSARFGKAFEDGDHTAVIALQQITIQLRRELLETLRAIVHEEEHVDLAPLVDTADSGRDRTITTLLELKQRLLQGGEYKRTSESSSYLSLALPASLASQDYENTHSAPRQESVASSRASKVRKEARNQHGSFNPPFADDNALAKFGRRPLDEPDSLLFSFPNDSATIGDQENQQSRRHRHSSLLHRLRHPRADSGQIDPFSTSSSLPKTSISSTSLNASSLQLATRQLSTVNSRGSYSSASSDSLLPNPDNNYLGFCKGAARLQNGDRTALQKTKEFNDGWSHSKVYYLSCSNSSCAFAGHMDLSIIWTKIWDVSEERGLKFRWPFLAKSHVCQSKAKNSQFAYQCLFCVFQGDQPPVLHGTDLYLEHISEEHRGQTLSDVVLYRTCCVNNRVCDDNDSFDINLLPLGPGEARFRKQSEVLSDDLLHGRKSGSDSGQLSVPVEPWNQGLSDFHYTDDCELTKMHSLRSFRSRSYGAG